MVNILTEDINNELVRYSRAGDVFHYRWAARRCLKMLNPLSKLKKVIIEGSANSKLAGEYVIDVSEYYGQDEDGIEDIRYFQLKHTTLHKNEPFTLSDFKKTICGFADRYKEHIAKSVSSTELRFYLVSNRSISKDLKTQWEKIIKNTKCKNRFMQTIIKYTGLKDQKLIDFLKTFHFIVGEGDYNDQMRSLHLEVANIVVGDPPQIDSITGLISEKALPDSDGVILQEDILKRFGCTSLSDLFPASVEYEKDTYVVPMEQHKKLVRTIVQAQNSIIIHAAGGVGKSIFARNIGKYLQNDSIAIVYDCFGSGKYRNRSRPRHRYRDALVQIINELSLKGLCDPIIVSVASLEDDILRKFLSRIKTVLINLKRTNEDAKIVLIIDAADNAEMAASEFGDTCFVHELLRENLPVDCHLVMLCRTERIDLLQPNSNIQQYELESFSEKETFALLKQKYQNVTNMDGQEFHRLTNGNPRIQANVLSENFETISDVLNSLGPIGTSVDEMIESQLDKAIARISDKLPPDFQKQIKNICTGLATLPPFIPISVLAKIAQVEESSVESFVSELGKPIWIADSVVQFRDEPTETWFHQRYAGTKQQIINYINILKPIANQLVYVAEVLPNLLLQAEYYDELIELALSYDFVPDENPIDKRNVIVYRLQFAFKAALKLKRYYDAAKIAMLAGEEMAGNKRQIEIFKKNIDLIAPLQDTQKVQEIAFKRMINGAWKGSANVYSASLLSNIPEFRGEAISYLRSSKNWLKLYFEERDKEERRLFNERLENEDIVEMAFAEFNLNGCEYAVKFILSWQPSSVIYDVTRIFSKKMIDLNQINELNLMAEIGKKNLFFIIAIVQELLSIGLFLKKEALLLSLEILEKGKAKLPDIEDSYINRNDMLKAVISFAELCTVHAIYPQKILDNYFPKRAPLSFDSNGRNETREIYLRSVALRQYLIQEKAYDVNELLPEKYIELKKEKNYQDEQKIRDCQEIINGLLPWYLARIKILANDDESFDVIIQSANDNTKQIMQTRYQRFDPIPWEISNIIVDILLFCKNKNEVISHYFNKFLINENKMWMDTQIRALRGANRLDHLSNIRYKLLEHVFSNIENCGEETETRAEYYIGVSRAIFSTSKEDAAEYFNMAITEVSRFGDEIFERWLAIVETAERSCNENDNLSELSYRFIRCAELVGENVARERYWDRRRAMQICTKLSPAAGLASLSRWRDRDVGWFEDLLQVVINETVKKKYISSLVAWSFVSFLEENEIPDFLAKCVKNEPDYRIQEKLINQGIHILRLFNTPSTVWIKIKKLADELNIKSEKLEIICRNKCNNDLTLKKDELGSDKYDYHKIEGSELQKIFWNLSLISSIDIAKAYERFKKTKDYNHNEQIFWEELFQRISDGDVLKFLFAFLDVDEFDGYLYERAFSNLPAYWKKKPSVKRKWPEILWKIAKKSTYYLLDASRHQKFIKSLDVDEQGQISINEGIIDGLIEMQGLESANIYFGFVNSMAIILDTQQARKLLDFSLSRFELHIEDSFGDGKWSSWLETPNVSNMTIAGFIWSAMGAPSSEIRWKAVHCVRLLGENGCQSEISSLINWLQKETVGAFGSNVFPFYYLHAKLYLLIAFARLSKENPELFIKDFSVFSNIALSSIPHVLMQIHAKRIALNIESAYANTYDRTTLDSLKKIGISPFDKKSVENKSRIFHEEGNAKSDIKFYHGYDFCRYWFEPLGRIFGMSEKQIEKLATMVIVDEWKIENDGSYHSDPRQGLWDSPKYSNKTYNDQGSFPSVERYNFYLSFHSMFVVASRLLHESQILVDSWYDDENQWEKWLNRYLLTSKNELMLFDRRDEVPLLLPEWMNKINIKVWNNEIDDEYFINTLMQNDESDVWLNICSTWTHGEENKRETVYISSAFVESTTSQALLNALASCKNPHDYKIPDYDETEMEFNEDPFVLKGWIVNEYPVSGLDTYDTLSGEIYYPVYKVGDSFAKKMNLSFDNKLKYWFIEGHNDACLKCRTWSYGLAHYRENEPLQGMNLFASLDFLKNLCRTEKKEMIIKVQISRDIRESHYGNHVSDSKYMPIKHKIFILSQEGKLRDERGNFEIRKITCK